MRVSDDAACRRVNEAPENEQASHQERPLHARSGVATARATFLINHFELFGLKQVWQALRGRQPTMPGFREPFLYRLVRHPLNVGWIITFWAIPVMSYGHLLFAVVASGYILIAVHFEERDLRRAHPEYADYSRRVPMLIPRWKARKA